MLKRIMLWIGTVLIGAFIIFSAEAIITQQALSEKTLRLHIVANSDRDEDQAQKLRLRDHILHEIKGMTRSCSELQEAEKTIFSQLSRLEKSAREFLRAEGCNYDVSVNLCKESFSTREYDTFSLPAGEYHSLRIIIGDGQGKNWWCVVFPSLCNAGTMEELDRVAEVGGYNETECDFIRRETPKYKLQFKVLEWLRGVFR